ncbi:helix-turn-helix transcriptional regulator [uncultured Hyphomicrobium sp.]|uniref:helix-turn-helix transcriptional regulator n=1 Tax=uncultured Hyphomicrobium sp. TaxID=194373 RepID=UPI00260122FD|nr:helix-turn-helix transcriptional regulator [uncultured Hyphomicrobium sp.]
MLNSLFERLTSDSSQVRQRQDGVAFFKASKELYGFTSIAYLGLNIHVPAQHGCLVHCIYTDTQVKHCVARTRIPHDALADSGLAGEASASWQDVDSNSNGVTERSLAIPLRSRDGETAFIGITAVMSADDWDRHKRTGMRDIRVLGSYFHSHVLRINGHDAGSDMLVSARELDCLKWTAAGKTAWEASVILGISERTVRFHLNAAREKLNCTTTTQAVAKAISYQLIDV